MEKNKTTVYLVTKCRRIFSSIDIVCRLQEVNLSWIKVQLKSSLHKTILLFLFKVKLMLDWLLEVNLRKPEKRKKYKQSRKYFIFTCMICTFSDILLQKKVFFLSHNKKFWCLRQKCLWVYLILIKTYINHKRFGKHLNFIT